MSKVKNFLIVLLVVLFTALTVAIPVVPSQAATIPKDGMHVYTRDNYTFIITDSWWWFYEALDVEDGYCYNYGILGQGPELTNQFYMDGPVKKLSNGRYKLTQSKGSKQQDFRQGNYHYFTSKLYFAAQFKSNKNLKIKMKGSCSGMHVAAMSTVPKEDKIDLTSFWPGLNGTFKHGGLFNGNPLSHEARY